MQGSAEHHEVHVFTSNGAVKHFTLDELRTMLRSWPFWVLVLVGFFIVSTGHSMTMPQFESVGLRLAFWLIALALYLIASTTYLRLAGWLWTRVFSCPIPMLVLSAPLVLSSTYASGAVLSLWFEPGRNLFDVMTWQMNVRNVLVLHVFETAALLWLIPAQRARENQTDVQRKITLSGRSFSLSQIARVKAAEHHLEVHGDDGVEIIRERMSTFLEQVTPMDGIQTHRSHWVAFGRASGLDGDRLCMPCGAAVPVARGRQDSVREWLQNHALVAEDVA